MFSSGSTQINVIQHERTSTRLYILLLFISVIVIIINTVVPIVVVNKRLQLSSLIQYEKLISQYDSSFHCPCSTISIPYQKFITINVTYHQICSSDFIKDIWIQYLSNNNYSTISARTDIRVSIGALFQLLSELCQHSQTTIQNAIDEFLIKTFLSVEIVSESQFLLQINDITGYLESNTARLFSHSLQLLRSFVHGNTYVSVMA
ncbi:unnamed protein product [Rotaria sp. Silwood1]|nr:unnamed protein product [Rotaria sp. Silwood1]CAF3899708.1 unnamed protein product [Rotaria sp. Silwood1]CAF5034014.1 unnamed protein product [Rotaria sp. Silwood1]CAF5035596.1 unnamed protein product [Rotaria sp. Silwood1]